MTKTFAFAISIFGIAGCGGERNQWPVGTTDVPPVTGAFAARAKDDATDPQFAMKLGIATGEYRLRPGQYGLSAPNRGAGIRATWSDAGVWIGTRDVPVTVEPGDDGQARITTTGIGRGDRFVPLRAPGYTLGECIANGEMDETGACLRRAEASYGDGIREWWENRKEGLEQGFVIDENPLAGSNRAPLEIHVGIDGDRVEVDDDRQAVRFRVPAGQPLVYSQLVVRDQDGKRIPSEFGRTDDGVALRIDDRDARYPLQVDPVLQAQPSWTTDVGPEDMFYLLVTGAGDVNKDGFSDVLVGNYVYDGGQLDEGKIFLFLGSSSGLGASAAWSYEPNVTSRTLGFSGVSFDYDGDSWRDFAVGCASCDQVAIFRSHASGSSYAIDTVAFNPTLPTGHSRFGWALGTADVDGNGKGDLIAGDPMGNYQASSGGGAFVFKGSATGLVQPYSWFKSSNQASAMYGYSVAGLGDTNGDHFDDVVVASNADVGGTGRATVYLGGSTGLGTTQAWTWTGDPGGYISQAAGAGDVNRDGFTDLLVASPNAASQFGRAYLFLGSSTGFPTTSPAYAWHADGPHSCSRLHYVAGAGDVDDDGYPDVLVGSPDDCSINGPGQAALYRGVPGPGGLQAQPSWTYDGATGDLVGAVAAAGDVNGDGPDDVIVAAAGQQQARAFLGIGTLESTSPVIVAKNSDLQQGLLAGTELDGQLTFFPGGTKAIGTHYDYTNEVMAQAIVTGTLDAPYTTVVRRPTCDRETSGYCKVAAQGSNAVFKTFAGLTNVNELWFTSLYSPGGTSEYLAFIHEEDHILATSYVGLAWTSDGGSTWKYLGRIVSLSYAYSGNNIQGVPYLVKDGNFYVYYEDSTTYPPPYNHEDGLAVARANVTDVVNAARNLGTVGSNLWHKYNNGNWTEPGIGGTPSFLKDSTGAKVIGINHTQAAHSSYTGKYYMPLTSETGDGVNATNGTYVTLHESTDGITWNPMMAIVSEGFSTMLPSSGYQYCSVVDSSGAGNAEVGAKFYVYCAKFRNPNPALGAHALYRWTVGFGGHADFYRQSIDFSSIQGATWFYKYGSSSLPMTFNTSAGYWQGTDAADLINGGGFHPGANEDPKLVWVAPKAGTVHISGTVRDADPSHAADNPPYTDGAKATVLYNSTPLTLNPPLAWNNGDTIGVSINQDQTVAKGDTITFTVNKNVDNYWDYTIWDPSIQYK